jgi:hypothetical protein
MRQRVRDLIGDALLMSQAVADAYRESGKTRAALRRPLSVAMTLRNYNYDSC